MLKAMSSFHLAETHSEGGGGGPGGGEGYRRRKEGGGGVRQRARWS